MNNEHARQRYNFLFDFQGNENVIVEININVEQLLLAITHIKTPLIASNKNYYWL
jgi:hypothetical protein